MIHFNIKHPLSNKHKKVSKETSQHYHSNKWKKILDKLMYPVSLIGPIMMLPQILKIFIEKDASSIALSSWLLFLLPASMWVIYGFSHKDKVIIICNGAWFISYLLVIIGTIIY